MKITKRIIRSSKSKNVRKYNDQKKREKRTTNYPQNTAQKTKDRETRTRLNNSCHRQISGHFVSHINDKITIARICVHY
jgi:hypothetical protein